MRAMRHLKVCIQATSKSPILILHIICNLAIREAHRPLCRCCCSASSDICTITS